MDHDMLDIRELLFNSRMYPFSDPMCLAKRNVRLHRDLQIYIDLVSKLPCPKKIDPLDTFL